MKTKNAQDYIRHITALGVTEQKQLYSFLLEDKGRTFNINCHSYDCFAVSYAEALGKMYINRPEFKYRQIERVLCDGEEIPVQ